MIKSLLYNTRDADGKDITKTVEIKKYCAIPVNFMCRICQTEQTRGVDIKKIVSGNFTDWQYVGEYVCEKCADMFSLFRYSYIQNGDDVRLFNVREMAEEIQLPQTPPFKIIVSTSQKKHLFYKAVTNHDPINFSANLEEEKILCNIDKLRELFLFVGYMQAIGESKKRLADGEIRNDILQKTGYRALKYLQNELKTRQIQIPLFLSQKINITQEEAICNLDLIVSH